jgi:hypothetical protein
METVIYISQLAPSTLTRPRGEETGRKAAVWARSRAVELDLEHTSPSLSFLDGLVLALQDARALHLVTFVTKDSMVRARLARIATMRNVSIPIHVDVPSQPTSSATIPPLELDQHLDHARAHSKFAWT